MKKRKRAAADTGPEPCPVSKKQETQTAKDNSQKTCSHWLHRIPEIFLEKDAMQHLNTCCFHQKPKAPQEPLGTRSKGRVAFRAARSQKVDHRLLERFARHGGPDLRDVCGYNLPTMSSREESELRARRVRRRAEDEEAVPSSVTSRSQPFEFARSPRESTRTSSSGAYHRNFEQYLIQSRVYTARCCRLNGMEQPAPNNEVALLAMLDESRASLSPSRFSEEHYKPFERSQDKANREVRVVRNVMPQILADNNPGMEQDMLFNNMENMMVAGGRPYRPKPDYYYGANRLQLDQRVREELSKYVVPSTVLDRPIAPNFFVEVKSLEANPRVAYRQTAAAGAMGARAMQSLRTYGDSSPVYDNNAYTLSSTYASGVLAIYAHFPILDPSDESGGVPEYGTALLNQYFLNMTAKAAAEGIRAFRNARDWAERTRNALIEHANLVSRQQLAQTVEADDPMILSSQQQAETEDSRSTLGSQSQAGPVASSRTSVSHQPEPQPTRSTRRRLV